MDDLPSEVLAYILSFTTFSRISKACCLVSKTWLAAVVDNAAIVCQFHPVSQLTDLDISWKSVIDLLAALEKKGPNYLPFQTHCMSSEARRFPCDFILHGPLVTKSVYDILIMSGLNVLSNDIGRYFMYLAIKHHNFELYFHIAQRFESVGLEVPKAFKETSFRSWAALYGAKIMFDVLPREYTLQDIKECFLTPNCEILHQFLSELPVQGAGSVTVLYCLMNVFDPVFSYECIAKSNIDDVQHLPIYRESDKVLEWVKEKRGPGRSLTWIDLEYRISEFIQSYAIPTVVMDECFTDNLHIFDPFDDDCQDYELFYEDPLVIDV